MNAAKGVVTTQLNSFLSSGLRSDMFYQSERDEIMVSMILSSLTITCVLIVIVVAILLDPYAGLFCGMCVGLVDLSVLGIMTAKGASMSIMMFIVLAMAVGMCVDYIMHITHVILREFHFGVEPHE